MALLKTIFLSFLFIFQACADDCYILKSRKQRAGFFSIFNTVIGSLDFIEKHNAQIIIDFGTESFFYDPTLGPNWWSYYFEPIFSHISEKTTYKTFKQYQTNTIFSLTAQFILSRERAHYLINRYIRLKPHIIDKIDQFVHEYFEGYYVIGIHYRGTDKVGEAPQIAYEMIHKEVTTIMNNVTDQPIRIFVATDDAFFLEYMHQTFGNQICALDALRSSDNTPVHMQENISPYKKGEDALIDSILLSKTNFLIKTASNLSDVSLQFNPDLPVIHLSTSYFE